MQAVALLACMKPWASLTVTFFLWVLVLPLLKRLPTSPM